MKRVVTFGEIMLRLAPEGYYRFVQAEKYGATFGGGEANVAVSLANYGVDSVFVSKVPKHEIGQACVNSLRKFGVDTDEILRGGDRIGIYYLEKGASQRPSKVIYDRAGSAISKRNLTGMIFLKELTGSTLQVLLPHLATMLQKFVLKLLKLQGQKELRSAVTLTIVISFGQKKRPERLWVRSVNMLMYA